MVFHSSVGKTNKSVAQKRTTDLQTVNSQSFTVSQIGEQLIYPHFVIP